LVNYFIKYTNLLLNIVGGFLFYYLKLNSAQDNATHLAVRVIIPENIHLVELFYRGLLVQVAAVIYQQVYHVEVLPFWPVRLVELIDQKVSAKFNRNDMSQVSVLEQNVRWYITGIVVPVAS
jgi:hypothetical protein